MFCFGAKVEHIIERRIKGGSRNTPTVSFPEFCSMKISARPACYVAFYWALERLSEDGMQAVHQDQSEHKNRKVFLYL